MKNRSSRVDLTVGQVPRTMLKLWAPMMIGIGSVILTYVFDAFFIAQLGTNYLAAITFTFPINMILGSISIGLGIGTTSVISRAFGKGDHERMGRLATDALALSILIVIGLVILGLLTITPLFKMLGVSDELMPLIKNYMIVWYPGMMFVVVPMVGNSIIRGLGNMKLPAMIMGLSAILNLALDPLLIFGYGPVPRLEMQGAAWASLISRFITFAAFFYYLHFKEKILVYRLPPFEKLVSSWKEVIKVAIPAAFTNLLSPLSVALVTPILAASSTAAVASFGIVCRVEAFVLIPVMALVSVMNPFVGQNFGKGDLLRIDQGFNFAQKFLWLWSLLIFVILYAFATPIAELFDATPEVINAAAFGLKLVPLSIATVGVALTIGSMFNAMGKPIEAAGLMFFRNIMLFVPLTYLLSRWYPMTGVYIAGVVAGLIAFFVALWRRKKDFLERT